MPFDETSRSAAAAQIAPDLLALLEEWKRSGQTLSRYTLAERFQCNERIIREAFHELRLRGHPVIAESDGGYRLARTAEEIRAYTATLKSRIMALREMSDALDHIADELDPTPLQPPLL